MTTMYVIILLAILIVVFFFFYKEYTNSRSYRIKKSVKTYKKLKLEEEKFINSVKSKGEEILNDENRIVNIIEKINKGEEVKIPIAAFQYIYTRLNEICVVDKNGNVQIVNSEEFKKFQETAISLLDKDKKIKEDAAKQTNDFTSVFTTKKYADGTIVKKNNVNGDITILKPDGTKYINKNETNDLIIEKPEEEYSEKNSSRNSKQNQKGEDINKVKNDLKNVMQENTYLKSQAEEKNKNKNDFVIDVKVSNENTDGTKNEMQNDATKNHKDEKVNIQNSNIEQEKKFFETFNDDENSSEKIDIKNLKKINKKEEEKTHEKVDAKESKNNFPEEEKDNEEIDKSVEVKNVNLENSSDALESIMNKFDSVVNTKKSKPKMQSGNKKEEQKEQEEKSERINDFKSLLEARKNMSIYDIEEKFNAIKKVDYENMEDFIKKITSGRNVMDFIFHLCNIMSRKYSNYYVFLHTEKKIYISVDLFIFKLSCYLSTEDRVKFLNDIKPKGEDDLDFINSHVADFLKSLNKILPLVIGAKPFYLNEEKQLFSMKKYTEFTTEEEKRYYIR